MKTGILMSCNWRFTRKIYWVLQNLHNNFVSRVTKNLEKNLFCHCYVTLSSLVKYRVLDFLEMVLLTSKVFKNLDSSFQMITSIMIEKLLYLIISRTALFFWLLNYGYFSSFRHYNESKNDKHYIFLINNVFFHK